MRWVILEYTDDGTGDPGCRVAGIDDGDNPGDAALRVKKEGNFRVVPLDIWNAGFVAIRRDLKVVK